MAALIHVSKELGGSLPRAAPLADAVWCRWSSSRIIALHWLNFHLAWQSRWLIADRFRIRPRDFRINLGMLISADRLAA